MPSVLATFLFRSPDHPGLVARLAGFFYGAGLNIVDASNHTDVHADAGPRFFMRLVVDLGGLVSPAAGRALGGSATRGALEAAFGALSTELGGTWSAGYSDHVPRVVILVTKDPACLYDLVLRQRAGEIACEIALIASNHPTLEPVAASFSIPFYCLPVTPDTKRAQEMHILELATRHHADLVVLARYMQILSDGLAAKFSGKCINIHHSFLPGFKGAKPYHQAHERGVKLIGATAHFVTSDLDEGPIIEQDVERISHRDTPDDLVRKGRDIERRVLARALSYALEDRVLPNGRKTVVFYG
jgi:formyltetrahydrofolate deformylase